MSARVVGLADVDAAIGREHQRARRVQSTRLRRRARAAARLARQRLAHHRLDAGAVDELRLARRLHHPKTLASPARAVSLPSSHDAHLLQPGLELGRRAQASSWRSVASSWNDVDW